MTDSLSFDGPAPTWDGAVPTVDCPALTACADWCCTKGCIGHHRTRPLDELRAALRDKTALLAGPLLTERQECARVCTCGGRATTRLHALVQHYERHLTATGREWVINEAHKRTETPRD